VVYLAHHRTSGRIVALKVIRPDRLYDLSAEKRQEWLARLLAEARAAAPTAHGKVRPGFEVGDPAGAPHSTLRYRQSRSVSEILREGPLPGKRAATYLEAVARAVHHAHTHQVLHRDLKPKNILVDETDRPMVSDFGLAKFVGDSPDLTHAGNWVGSPPYMSP